MKYVSFILLTLVTVFLFCSCGEAEIDIEIEYDQLNFDSTPVTADDVFVSDEKETTSDKCYIQYRIYAGRKRITRRRIGNIRYV